MRNPCHLCGATFEIPQNDLAFYAMISPTFGGKRQQIPPPTLCPSCRRQRRLAWRNEKKLYHRTCDFTKKPILSIYSPDKSFTVYEQDAWMSDAWDPLSYGRTYDFSRPFFDQWNDLHHAVPLPSMNLRFQNENSEYTNLSARNKNCYMIFAGNDNEECEYSTYIQRCHRAVDCFFTFDSEICYECIDCYSCNRLFYSQYCRNCSDSALLINCQGCSNCFGCVNLANQQYRVFNEPCAKEEYEDKVKAALGNRSFLKMAQLKVRELERSLPHKYLAGFGNENVSGDHIFSSKNSHECFDVTYLEDCKYCVWMHQSKSCYDCYGWGLPGELGLENHLTGENFYNVQFSESCWGGVSDLLYCRYCLNGCSHCFGCIGLQHKEYCILNKQYTKEEYEELVPRIITQMKEQGSFGEFFPHALSPYGYNETVAQTYFPLSEAEVKNGGWPAGRSAATKDETVAHLRQGFGGQPTLRAGWNWRTELLEEQKVMGKAGNVPNSIAEVSDSITQDTLACSVTGRPYRIIPQELKFYREIGVPVPTKCFDQRHLERIALRNPRELWKRKCGKCGKEMESSFQPSRPEHVYCEDCYLQSVY
ncbi:MAG: hypothetical protein WCG83_02005 [Candidatus Peregrinibacteria bacterium]